MGANVTVLDANGRRLAYLDDIFPRQITTLYATRENIVKAISQADLVVGAVLLPGRSAPKLVKGEDLALMKSGAVARTATQALVNATLPYGLELAAKGVEKTCAEDKGLLAGLNCYGGKCTLPGVAEALGLEYVDPSGLI